MTICGIVLKVRRLEADNLPMSNYQDPFVEVSPGCWIRERYVISTDLRRAVAEADRNALELILSDLAAKVRLPEGSSSDYGLVDLTGPEPVIDLP